MPLVSKESKRFENPEAPGEWYELRPLNSGDMAGIVANGNRLRLTHALLVDLCTAWSHEEDITIETAKQLDISTWLWLTKVALANSGIRGAEEKKDSNGHSRRTTGRAKASTRSSSGT